MGKGQKPPLSVTNLVDRFDQLLKCHHSGWRVEVIAQAAPNLFLSLCQPPLEDQFSLPHTKGVLSNVKLNTILFTSSNTENDILSQKYIGNRLDRTLTVRAHRATLF